MITKFSSSATLIGSLALSFLFGSCSGQPEYAIQQKEMNTTDSLISVQASYLEFSSPSPELNTWFAGINAAIYHNLTAQKDTISYYSAEDPRRLEEISWPPYELMMTDTVYLANKNLISVLYTTYSFTGGAHGMTEFAGHNYDLVNRKELTVQDLFKPEATTQINKLLAEYFQNPDNCFSDQPTLEQATAVNLGVESVIFTYAQYVLGPYACGPATITLPLAAIKPFLLMDLNLSRE